EQADVFVTNLRPSALRRLELDYDSLAAQLPRLVYASVSGYGGVAEDRPGYDIGAYWSRSGLANALTAPGQAPPVSRPGHRRGHCSGALRPRTHRSRHAGADLAAAHRAVRDQL